MRHPPHARRAALGAAETPPADRHPRERSRSAGRWTTRRTTQRRNDAHAPRCTSARKRPASPWAHRHPLRLRRGGCGGGHRDDDAFPVHLGHCQIASPLVYDSRNMDRRNILWLTRPCAGGGGYEGALWLLHTPRPSSLSASSPLYDGLLAAGVRPLRTIHEGDVGSHLADIIYLHPLPHRKPQHRLFVCLMLVSHHRPHRPHGLRTRLPARGKRSDAAPHDSLAATEPATPSTWGKKHEHAYTAALATLPPATPHPQRDGWVCHPVAHVLWCAPAITAPAAAALSAPSPPPPPLAAATRLNSTAALLELDVQWADVMTLMDAMAAEHPTHLHAVPVVAAHEHHAPGLYCAATEAALVTLLAAALVDRPVLAYLPQRPSAEDGVATPSRVRRQCGASSEAAAPHSIASTAPARTRLLPAFITDGVQVEAADAKAKHVTLRASPRQLVHTRTMDPPCLPKVSPTGLQYSDAKSCDS
jgi:hypothetical protein